MKILKGAGSFEVLTRSDNVIENIANAARTCYQTQDYASSEKDNKLVKHLISRGHHAMLEFADMTVRFDNVSIGLTREQNRHRLTSIAEESTRRVDESDFKVIVPPHKDEKEQLVFIKVPETSQSFTITLAQWFDMNEQMYRGLRKEGWRSEDARQVLPLANKSQEVIKANMREWRHIFKMRCDKYAHWEIRGVMLDLLNWCQCHIPYLFDDFHFFKTDEAKSYARPVMTQTQLQEEQTHYNRSR